ncbi:MAG: Cof-type HAD-IIB family hydrolase [Hungatella sp.]
MKIKKAGAMKPIVSFDIDMTLLDHKTWRIPESAMKAVEMLRKTYMIVIATGRDMDASYSTSLRDQIHPDAIIHLNGTKITVGDQVIFEHEFDKRLLKQVLDYAGERPYSIGTTLEGQDYYVHPSKVEEYDLERFGESSRNFADPWKLMEKKVHTLAYIGTEAEARSLEQHFPEISVHMFGQHRGADVVERAVSKAIGLRRLCEYYGTKMQETVAFGDSMNDYDILKAAGVGIAMGNAMEELKAAADYVTDDVDRDGIWKACLHLHLIE